MRDFTIKQYIEFIEAIKKKCYATQTFEAFIKHPKKLSIVLRHDVDRRPKNSLTFAKIQTTFDILGTYYFRMTPESFNEQIIKEIAAMGHEIGYHYETMDTCRGNIDKAYDMFCRNLKIFRKIVPVSTICMHGSPLSKYDNRTIWKKYDYRDLGLIAEPYFDLDFKKIVYITDTGRRWDGDKVNFRDKSMTSDSLIGSDLTIQRYHSTVDIINAIHCGDFPLQSMITFHPQRWTENTLLWLKELLSQNIKNQVKKNVITLLAQPKKNSENFQF